MQGVSSAGTDEQTESEDEEEDMMRSTISKEFGHMSPVIKYVNEQTYAYKVDDKIRCREEETPGNNVYWKARIIVVERNFGHASVCVPKP